MKELVYTHEYFLAAGSCNASGKMPITLLTTRIIEVATEHANRLGIGYATLTKLGIGWVLSRLSIEMKRMPGINETYSLTTWIEGWNRMYSDRCMVVKDGNGEILGYVRSVWVAIDIAKRTAADLSVLQAESLVCTTMECPIAKQRKMLPVSSEATKFDIQFGYCDIDFNRHVNSVRYIEHILNLWSPEFFDVHEISRFDIAYIQECHYGDTAHLSAEVTEDGVRVDLMHDEGRAVAANLKIVHKI
jgi:acyl-ACP thioesterase